MEELQYLAGVSTLELDKDQCIGCGECQNVCPHQVLMLIDRKAEIVDHDSCIECGACVTNCPVEALSVTPGVG